MKEKSQLAALILAVSLVAGCASSNIPEITEETHVPEITEETHIVETTAQESAFVQESPAVTETTPEPEREYILSPEGQAELDKAVEDMAAAIAFVESSRHDDETMYIQPYEANSGYDELSDDAKAAYDIMVEKAENFEEYTYDTTLYDERAWLFAEAAMRLSEPRLACYTFYDIDERGTTLVYLIIDADGTQIEDTDIVRERMNTFDAITQTTVSMIPEDLSTYDKYRVIARFVSERAEYNYGIYSQEYGGTVNDYTAYASICGGKTVCAGYANGFDYMCRCAGLYSAVMHGKVGDESHAWNLVALEDGTYHVDVCWCDDTEMQGGEWGEYFMLNDEEIRESRTISGDYHSTGTKTFN